MSNQNNNNNTNNNNNNNNKLESEIHFSYIVYDGNKIF